jgi:hypothetical protein
MTDVRFFDSEGLLRVFSESAQHNCFMTADDAETSGQAVLRNGADLFVWRFADGTFEWTAIPDPRSPGYPAELVKQTVVVQR